jgi:hypothetical protein
MDPAVTYLRWQWQRSAERLLRRLDGLGADEFFREPVAGCWNVRPDPAVPGRWQIDYPWPPPSPPPVTTIAWRLVHLANGNRIYWEHAFGPGLRTFTDLVIPGDAGAAVADWAASRAPVTAWLDAAGDADLAEDRPSHLGGTRTAGEVMSILVDEQTHHGAEIALLRDLYRAG